MHSLQLQSMHKSLFKTQPQSPRPGNEGEFDSPNAPAITSHLASEREFESQLDAPLSPPGNTRSLRQARHHRYPRRGSPGGSKPSSSGHPGFRSRRQIFRCRHPHRQRDGCVSTRGFGPPDCRCPLRHLHSCNLRHRPSRRCWRSRRRRSRHEWSCSRSRKSSSCRRRRCTCSYWPHRWR